MNEWLSRLRGAWDNFSPREQMLLYAAGTALGLTLVWLAVVMPIMGLADATSRRVETAEQQIAAMVRLQREYLDIQGRLAGVERRIQEQRGEKNIRTLLETLAQQSLVRIASMEERQAGKNEQYVETKVEVSLKSVTLSQTIRYLHQIETADRQLSVKSLRIKGRADKSNLLDVTFAVSAFEPA